ncbi:hypothetical protein DPEC_G00316770 [Dallia pectoralis]|uniref:Uncharacterized protein n=1 Tax=Dallia pectoralis TaxID=75939 RepID=A0ACC2FCU3_DALPE|nr:hypothetical protein DPEC_G00316770 [Dallia pectoralis]
MSLCSKLFPPGCNGIVADLMRFITKVRISPGCRDTSHLSGVSEPLMRTGAVKAPPPRSTGTLGRADGADCIRETNRLSALFATCYGRGILRSTGSGERSQTL